MDVGGLVGLGAGGWSLASVLAEFGEVVDGDDVDDEAAACAEAFVGVFADAGDFAAAAGDEDGVGVGELVADFGGAAEDGGARWRRRSVRRFV